MKIFNIFLRLEVLSILLQRCSHFFDNRLTFFACLPAALPLIINYNFMKMFCAIFATASKLSTYLCRCVCVLHTKCFLSRRKFFACAWKFDLTIAFANKAEQCSGHQTVTKRLVVAKLSLFCPIFCKTFVDY